MNFFPIQLVAFLSLFLSTGVDSLQCYMDGPVASNGAKTFVVVTAPEGYICGYYAVKCDEGITVCSGGDISAKSTVYMTGPYDKGVCSQLNRFPEVVETACCASDLCNPSPPIADILAAANASSTLTDINRTSATRLPSAAKSSGVKAIPIAFISAALAVAVAQLV